MRRILAAAAATLFPDGQVKSRLPMRRHRSPRQLINTLAGCIAWPALLCFTQIGRAANLPSSSANQESRVKVTIDPRVEMLCAALMQSSWTEAKSGFLSPYARDMQRAFFPFRNHPTVKRLGALRDSSTFGDLVAAILKGEPIPTEDSPRPTPAITGHSEASLAAGLKLFIAESHAEDFVKAHEPFYMDLRHDAGPAVPTAPMIDKLEQFLGIQPSQYEVLVLPVLRDQSFGLARPDGNAWTFQVGFSPTGMVSDKLQFHSGALRHGLPILITKSLVSTWLSNSHSDTDSRVTHAEWWQFVGERMRSHGIRDWNETVIESIARAAAIRYWASMDQPEDALDQKRAALSAGLDLVPFFQERLIEYESNRAAYPSLKEFLPLLLAQIDELEPVVTGTGEPGNLGLSDVWLTDAGVPVKSVEEGSLAARAGIMRGDTVQSIAGIRINGSESYLKAWKRWESARNGEPVRFGILRRGKAMSISIIMRRQLNFEGFRRRRGL